MTHAASWGQLQAQVEAMLGCVVSLYLQTSMWRSAEMVDGRSYGRVPEASLGGNVQVTSIFVQITPAWLLTLITSFFP